MTKLMFPNTSISPETAPATSTGASLKIFTTFSEQANGTKITSLPGVKRTPIKTVNHSALLRKHNIDLKRFEPFVSTDDLYQALQGVYFLRYRNRA